MSSIINKIARELKGALPFAIVNNNPKNSLARKISYKNISEAQSDGHTSIITDNSIVYSKKTFRIPSVVSTTLNAAKVVIYDLDNPNHVWDWNQAKKLIKNTSWYQELGPPPIHGFFISSNDRTRIHWVDRDSPTLDIYMTFNTDTSGTGVFDGLAGNPYDFAVLDFKLYVCGEGGLPIVDFIQDDATSVNSSRTFKACAGGLVNRNSAGNVTQWGTGPLLTSQGLRAIAVTRDTINNRKDNHGRPLHYYAVNTTITGVTPGPAQVFLPQDLSQLDGRAISYMGGRQNSTITASNTWDIHFSQAGKNGNFLYLSAELGNPSGRVHATEERLSTIAGNDFFDNIQQHAGTNEHDPPSRSYHQAPGITGDLRTLSTYNPPDADYLLAGWSTGLVLSRGVNLRSGATEIDNAETIEKSTIIINSTYASPLMVGQRYACYPLHNGNDIGGGGRHLSTAVGAGPTFSSTGGPLGPKASFDGTTGLNITPVAFEGSRLGVSCYVRFNSFTGYMPIIGLWTDQTNDRSWNLYTSEAGGYLGFGLTMWTGSINTDLSTGNIFPLDTNKWYHVAFSWKAGAFERLFVDGVLIDNSWSVAYTGGLQNNPGVGVNIGAGSNGTSYIYFLNGDIANVMLSENYLTNEQVRLECKRMKQGLNSSVSQVLASDSVTSIRSDENSGYSVVCAGNTAHIIDSQTGIIYDKKAISSGTLNYADITSVNYSERPQYVLVGSESVEQVTSDVII